MEAAERLRLATKAGRVGIFDWDMRTNEVVWSREHEKIWGYGRGEFPGTFKAFIDRVHPDDRSEVELRIARAAESGGEYDQEFRVVRPDGSVIWVAGQGQIAFGSDGRPARMLGAAVEVTARRQVDEAMRFLAQYRGSTEPGTFFEPLTQFLAGILGMDFVSVGRVVPGADMVQTLAVFKDGESRDNFEYVLQGTPCAKLMEGEACVYPEGVSRLFPDDPGLAGNSAESYAAVTLWDLQGAPIGIISTIGRRPLREPAHAEAILKLVAIRASAEMERGRAQALLQASQEFASATLDAVAAQLCVVDGAGRVVVVNQSWRDFADKNGGTGSLRAGVEFSYLEVCRAAARLGLEAGGAMAAGLSRVLSGSIPEFTLEYPCHSATELRWFLARVRKIPGASGHAVVTHEDVTELKLGHHHEARQRQLLSDLVAGAPLARLLGKLAEGLEAAILGARCAIVLRKEGSADLVLGAAPGLSAFLGQDVHGASVTPGPATCRIAAYSGQRVVVPDIEGDPRWVPHLAEATAAEIRASWSEPIRGTLGVLGAITVYFRRPLEPLDQLGPVIEAAALSAAVLIERRAAEDELVQRRQEINAALDVARMADWEFDLLREMLIFNDRFYALIGTTVDREGGYAMPAETYFREICHPEDAPRVMQVVAQATHSPQVESTHSIEYRVVRRDNGETRFVWVQYRIVADESGRGVRAYGALSDITERRTTELKLTASEESLQEAQALAHLGSWEFRPAEQSGSWSDEMFRIYGRDPARGVPPWPEFVGMIHDDDRAAVARDFEEAIRIGMRLERTFRIALPNGEVRWVESRGQVFRAADGVRMLGTSQDVTDRERANEALRVSSQLLEASQSIAKLGGWELDITSGRLYWTAETYRIHETSPQEFNPTVDAGVGYFLPESRRIISEALKAAVERGEGYDLELETYTTKGRRIDVRTTCSVTWAYGKPSKLTGIFQDITESKLIQSHRESLQAQLQQAQKMEAIGLLAAGVAHDFNNLLATIMGNVELAQLCVDRRDLLLQSLEEIQRAGARGRNIVDRILDFSRREPLERRVQHLDRVVANALRLVRNLRPQGTVIETHIQAATPPALVDGTRIEQVIINLATNAMQALPDKRGRVDIHLDSVLLNRTLAVTDPALRAMYETRPDSMVVRIAVRDTGGGMDSPTMSRIFEPFFTTKPVGEGTGLGLSVVYDIVRAHEGAIVVASQLGQGSTFALYLPAVKGDVARVDEPVVSVVRAPENAAPGRHILYLDDEESQVSMVTMLLQSKGFRVSGATRPEEALNALRATPQAFDILLTDFNMPTMSGLEVSRKARAIKPDLKIGVITGFISDQLRAQADEAGVTELILKGTMEGFYASIRRLAGPA